MKKMVLLFLLTIACRTAPPPAPQQLPFAPSNSGAVSAKLLADPNAPEVQLPPDEEFVPARLRPENPTPVYPSSLLSLRLDPQVIAVRVIFDETGRTMQVCDSPVGVSTGGDYAPLFEAAVREAVSRWKCQPPRIRKFRAGPDEDHDGKPDYRILSGEKIFKTFFDLSFEFEVVDGKAVVKRTS